MTQDPSSETDDLLEAILKEQRRTNELLEALLAVFSPAEPVEEGTPPAREKQKCQGCKATFLLAQGADDRCPYCQTPAAKGGTTA
jgi:rubrerythrin